MRNTRSSTDDDSDDDDHQEASRANPVTQDVERDLATRDNDPTSNNNDDQNPEDNDDNIDASNNNDDENTHDDDEDEADDENEDEDHNEDTDEAETNINDPEDNNNDEETTETNQETTHQGNEEDTPVETPTDNKPTTPPTIAEVVQHLQDPKDRNSWREALAETAQIPAIYESTASDQLQQTLDPTSTIQLYTNWAVETSEDIVAHIATGFAIMDQGAGDWMADAFAALLRDKHPPPQLHLVRMTAADRFTVIHGRTEIRTSAPSAQKGLWAAFAIDATGDEQRLLLAKPNLFKAGKVISPVEVLQSQMMATGTKATTNRNEQATRIPTICPVPLTWAATILQHPEWTAQATAQYITSQMMTWDLADTHVSATAELVWRYLCGALTAGSKARPTVRFRFSANPATFDQAASKFLDNLRYRLWSHGLTPTARKQAPLIKQEEGRRTSGRIQQRQLATTASTATTATPDRGAAKDDRSNKSNKDSTTATPDRGTKPNTGATVATASTATASTAKRASTGGTKQRPGTTKQSGSLLKAGGATIKRKGIPSTGGSNLNLARAPANKKAKQTTAKQSGGNQVRATGPPGATAQPPPGTGTGTTTLATTPPLNTSTAALTALLQSPDILARTIGALAQAQVTQANQLAEQRTMNQHFRALTAGTSGGGDGDGATARKTKWNDAKKARFAAWANLPMDSPLLPDFWPALIQAASDDKEAIIAGLFNSLRDEHWEFQGWDPSPQLVADIQKLVMRPPMMSENKYHRGITPMAFADVDLHELEAAWANNAMLSKYDSKLSLSTAEAMALEHKTPLQPTTVDTLRLCIRRCMLFLKAAFGNQCLYYVVVKDVCTKLLRLTQRLKHSPSFMQRRGPSILWELSHVSYDFFGQVFTANTFLEATQFEEPAPKATAPTSLDHLLSLDSGPSADLPSAWLPNSRPPPQERHRGPGNGQGQPPKGGGGHYQHQTPSAATNKNRSTGVGLGTGFQHVIRHLLHRSTA